MATKTLQELRHDYKVAYTGYMNSVHTLSEASIKGERLARPEFASEEIAFNALAHARRALLEKLRDCPEPATR